MPGRHAITRCTRFLFDQQQRRRRRMHEEAAFHCVQCGKPFATSSMIEKMTAKLGGHWMFQDEQALKRLRMCGDCRVRAIFGEEIGGHANEHFASQHCSNELSENALRAGTYGLLASLLQIACTGPRSVATPARHCRSLHTLKRTT
ncbi:MAG: hypothetical protein R3F37_22840 [Candidatus Competibacteraceae bacterium]